jgi:hypothetical protein
MGSIADSLVVKILLGVATAAVWFVLSRAASADTQFAGTFAVERMVAQAPATH